MIANRKLAAIAGAVASLGICGQAAPPPAPPAAMLPPPIFTSLELPPSPAYVRALAAAGVRVFDFDLDRPGAARSVAEIKQAGGTVTAYHVGGGGGREWGSVKAGEQVRKYDTPEQLAQLTEDVKRLVAKGADLVHFDNTHRMSGKRLEAIADAIVAGGAGFTAKNNADKWSLVMKRRPDLRPAYAVIEAAAHDADETAAARELAAKGVPTYVVGFRTTTAKSDEPPLDDAQAAAYREANPSLRLLHMNDMRHYRYLPTFY